jgi:hypothetical protein
MTADSVKLSRRDVRLRDAVSLTAELVARWKLQHDQTPDLQECDSIARFICLGLAQERRLR